jgi:hypothetical protein
VIDGSKPASRPLSMDIFAVKAQVLEAEKSKQSSQNSPAEISKIIDQKNDVEPYRFDASSVTSILHRFGLEVSKTKGEGYIKLVSDLNYSIDNEGLKLTILVDSSLLKNELLTFKNQLEGICLESFGQKSFDIQFEEVIREETFKKGFNYLSDKQKIEEFSKVNPYLTTFLKDFGVEW